MVTFNEELKLEGGLCFFLRGEPQVLGKSPSGNIDGMVAELEADALAVTTFKGAPPAMASRSNDAICLRGKRKTLGQGASA